MSDFFDRFIADLVKGASSNLRENGGPGVNIIVSRENRGREEKLASIGGALGGGLLGGGAGALGGSLAGAGTGALLAKLLRLDPSVGQELGSALGLGGAAVGGLGGAAAGTAAGQEDRKPGLMDRLKGASLTAHYDAGIKAAADAFGVKEAFLPMLGAIAGPALARFGLGRLAAGAGGRMLGGLASKVAPRIAGGLGGMAFDQAAGMAGGALGQHMEAPRPPAM